MVYIQLERPALLALCYWSAGTDLVVLTFQLLLIRRRNYLIFSFLFSFFYFFFVSFYRIFLDVFFASLPSLTHSPPSPANPSMLQTRGNDHSFCFRPFVRLFSVLGLHKKYGLFYGLKVFALIDVLVSWMTGLRTERSFQQRLEREHRLFHKRKINNNKNEETK